MSRLSVTLPRFLVGVAIFFVDRRYLTIPRFWESCF